MSTWAGLETYSVQCLANLNPFGDKSGNGTVYVSHQANTKKQTCCLPNLTKQTLLQIDEISKTGNGSC